eukprot:TRINITY_DN47714_c0_g1_i1.p1 TRINITY_DN47714_c0_g1~~TRINITY_DN47714_c0_g1_i1.p1  ORF type:complete len:355 (-),score=45.53 TRINITY_DN47714_c0_g1_i1:262-1179(-)
MVFTPKHRVMIVLVIGIWASRPQDLLGGSRSQLQPNIDDNKLQGVLEFNRQTIERFARIFSATTSSHMRKEKTDHATMCSFSESAAKYPPWDSATAARFDAALQAFVDANVSVILGGGSLLGAYRHHGTIPLDEDVDMTLDVCNHMWQIQQSKSDLLQHHSCGELEGLQKQDPETFHSALWNDVFQPLLKPRGIKLVSVLNYGLRLTNGDEDWLGGIQEGRGVGIDFVPAFSGVPDVCTCTYGSSRALCPVDSAEVLRSAYGEDFMTPKSQCDYYAESGHSDWSFRTSEECDWARKYREGTNHGQ